ncbi:MAG: type VI secretion system protein TssR domain-containing protein [Bacteroidota bacterium]
MTLRFNFAVLGWLLLLLLPSLSSAQRKVLGAPESFLRPVDFFDNQNSYEKYLLDRTSPKLRKEGWFVFSDRNNNPLYEKPGGAAIDEIGFRDHFFVVEEKNEWVKVMEVTVDELKIIDKKGKSGWIPKSKLLLWPRGIIDPITGINKKVLLLNKADEIERYFRDRQGLDLVAVFTSPDGTEKLSDRNIFEYFFVLKRENGRILVSAEAELGVFNKDKVIGWIDERDCTIWNSRVCLEPNFMPSAYEERKSRSSYHIKGFKSLSGAIDYNSGGASRGEIFWDYDPVKQDARLMSEANPFRYNGSIIRFPMVAMESNGGIDYFQTGIVGKIQLSDKNQIIGDLSEVKWSNLKKYKDQLVHKSANVNIFFLIEGTESVAPYKPQIMEAISDIYRQSFGEGRQVRYGAMIYRDIPEEKGNGITQHIALTSQFDQVKTFVENTPFESLYDRDEYTALYYGLNKALKVGGFDKKDLNIVLILGSYGDFKVNKSRKLSDANHPAYIKDSESIIRDLNDIEANVYSIQVHNDGYRAAKSFSAISQHLILETAKYSYNTTYGSSSGQELLQTMRENSDQFKIEVPTMELDPADTRTPLEGASILGALNRPSAGNSLSAAQVRQIMAAEIANSIGFVSTFKEVVVKMIDNGETLEDSFEGLEGRQEDGQVRTAGEFAPAMAKWLYGILEGREVPVEDIIKEKLRLFTEVYLPRNLPDAQYPTVSYVLFMPENDLRDYQQTINRCVVVGGSYDKKREALFEVYKALVEQFTQDWNGGKDITRNDLIAQMQGVGGMGLKIDDPLDHVIEDVLNSKKVSNGRVDEIIARFAEVSTFLDGIIRQGDAYDFCYATDELNRYYWIPIESAF